jgi:hypothetical protein
MPSALELLARYLVRTLHAVTAGRHGQGRMLDELAVDAGMGEQTAAQAVDVALRKGWIEERMRSVYLTESGRRAARRRAMRARTI